MNSMMKAIKILKEDINLGDIGSTIQDYMLRLRVFLLFKIFVAMVLVTNFSQGAKYSYIMGKKEQEKKLKLE